MAVSLAHPSAPCHMLPAFIGKPIKVLGKTLKAVGQHCRTAGSEGSDGQCRGQGQTRVFPGGHSGVLMTRGPGPRSSTAVPTLGDCALFWNSGSTVETRRTPIQFVSVWTCVRSAVRALLQPRCDSGSRQRSFSIFIRQT